MPDKDGQETPKESSQALQEIKALLEVKGSLLIITAEHACGSSPRGPADDKEQKTCDGYGYPTTHPQHFVIHEAVRLQEKLPATPKQIRVYSKEGDYTQGRPAAVLRRLRKAGGA